VNIDTNVHPDLINPRFAYVSISRASQDAQIFTNDANMLSSTLSHTVTKTSAIEVIKQGISVPKSPLEPNLTQAGMSAAELGPSF
jgi:hypothetical protein